MKMLTVDDSAVIRKIICEGVGTLGYECYQAEEAEEALQIIEDRKGKLDLIFLDWNMPGMKGLELLKRLKAEENYKNIPVMIVTADNTSEHIIEAVKAGATNYISKPFGMEELMIKINECLGKGVF